MGLLVGAMDIATANNTVAIVMANPIAHEMAETYNVSRRKTASILDTFSCVFQGVIPYGAQMLVAISACTELGFQVSAFQIMPFLFYPFFLLISSLVFIFMPPPAWRRRLARRRGLRATSRPAGCRWGFACQSGSWRNFGNERRSLSSVGLAPARAPGS